MIAIYILAFCRVVIGLVFAFSSLSKVRDFARFKQAILGFRLVPTRSSGPLAVLVLGGECVVVLLVAIGGPLLFYGLALAALLLCLFCVALALVLVRKLQTPCNCFGAGEKPVGPADLWRNAAFILCAAGGCGLLGLTGGRMGPAGLEWLVIAPGALVFVVTWIQFGEIIHLFRQR